MRIELLPECPRWRLTGNRCEVFSANALTSSSIWNHDIDLGRDADWICNWYGGLESAHAIVYDGAEELKKKRVSTYFVDGVPNGTFKGVENLSWMRVFEAGHHAPYYQLKLALQAFKLTMQRKAVFST